MNRVPWSTIDQLAYGSAKTRLSTSRQTEQGCSTSLVGQGSYATFKRSESDRWLADMGDEERPVVSISGDAPYTFLPNSTNLGR